MPRSCSLPPSVWHAAHPARLRDHPVTGTAPSLAAGLRVIGAGMGRTGTDALRHALDALGVGPTYHMIELLGISDTQTRPVSPFEMLGLAPGHNDLWAEANANISKGVAPDFSAILRFYACKLGSCQLLLTLFLNILHLFGQQIL